MYTNLPFVGSQTTSFATGSSYQPVSYDYYYHLNLNLPVSYPPYIPPSIPPSIPQNQLRKGEKKNYQENKIESHVSLVPSPNRLQEHPQIIKNQNQNQNHNQNQNQNENENQMGDDRINKIDVTNLTIKSNSETEKHKPDNPQSLSPKKNQKNTTITNSLHKKKKKNTKKSAELQKNLKHDNNQTTLQKPQNVKNETNLSPHNTKKRKTSTDKRTQKKSGKKQKLIPTTQAPISRTLCRWWVNGACSKGSECTFAHVGEQNKRSDICKFFRTDSCRKGDTCLFSHDLKGEPCKHFYLHNHCRYGENCNYSHDLEPSVALPLLERLAEEAKKPQEEELQVEKPTTFEFPSLFGSGADNQGCEGVEENVKEERIQEENATKMQTDEIGNTGETEILPEIEENKQERKREIITFSRITRSDPGENSHKAADLLSKLF